MEESGEWRRRPRLDQGKTNHSRGEHKRPSASRNCGTLDLGRTLDLGSRTWDAGLGTLDLGLAANTLCQNNKPIAGERHEIRHLLRAAIAAPVAGRLRTQALPGRADATGDRRPPRL